MKHFWIKVKHPVLYYHYLFRFKKKVCDFPKLIYVVLSCETYDQCKTAFFYLERYIDVHGLKTSDNDSKGFNIFSKILMERIAMYLQDTMDHDKKGYHYSQMNEYEISNIWPDLTLYIGDLLNMRFPKVWTRNCVIQTRVNET